MILLHIWFSKGLIYRVTEIICVVFSCGYYVVLPSQCLCIFHKVNIRGCILLFSYQDGRKRIQVLVKLCWLAKEWEGFSRHRTMTQDSQTVLSLCFNYKSQEYNGHSWHLDIFTKSKRPGLNGNRFHFTNLELTTQAFSCMYLKLSWNFFCMLYHDF